MKRFALAIALCLGVGCVSVPRTMIKGNMTTGEFQIAAPKDGTLEGFQLTRLTNGAIQITIQKHTVRMSPEVIQQTAAGQAQIIQATSQGVGAALGEMLAKALAAYTGNPAALIPKPIPSQ